MLYDRAGVPCLPLELYARDVPLKHEHGWIDLEEVGGG
jgi:hypothetical protein